MRGNFVVVFALEGIKARVRSRFRKQRQWYHGESQSQVEGQKGCYGSANQTEYLQGQIVCKFEFNISFYSYSLHRLLFCSFGIIRQLLSLLYSKVSYRYLLSLSNY